MIPMDETINIRLAYVPYQEQVLGDATRFPAPVAKLRASLKMGGDAFPAEEPRWNLRPEKDPQLTRLGLHPFFPEAFHMDSRVLFPEALQPYLWKTSPRTALDSMLELFPATPQKSALELFPAYVQKPFLELLSLIPQKSIRELLSENAQEPFRETLLSILKKSIWELLSENAQEPFRELLPANIKNSLSQMFPVKLKKRMKRTIAAHQSWYFAALPNLAGLLKLQSIMVQPRILQWHRSYVMQP